MSRADRDNRYCWDRRLLLQCMSGTVTENRYCWSIGDCFLLKSEVESQTELNILMYEENTQ